MKNTVYHIIDLKSRGTIFNLIKPLSKKDKNHKIIISGSISEKYKLKKLKKDSNAIILIHSTGSLHSKYLYNYENIFNNRKSFVFLHVSINYIIKRGRKAIIKQLKFLSKKYGITFITPSPATTIQLKKMGLKAKYVQLGIEDINIKKYKKQKIRLKKYYNKIITTCTSASNNIYYFAKGIDRFEKIGNIYNINQDCLIAGTNQNLSINIKSKKFKKQDFLNILCHSKMYVQLSRYETYNITAIQAKRFKIPCIIYDVEGTSFCMNDYVFKNKDEIINEITKIINNNSNKKIINDLYIDSLKRESLLNFKNNLEMILKGVSDNEKNISFTKL